MTVSRRLRYEILRRDNHTCRYCGAVAPDVPLTIDHVTPVALGGTDAPTNLVTACRDCNAGKSATAPDSPLVDDVAQDALRWANAMKLTADAFVTELNEKQLYRGHVDGVWSDWTYGSQKLPLPRPLDWEDTVDRFVAAGMTAPLLTEAIRRAMAAWKVEPENTWRYFCGIAWNQIAEMQQVARQIAAAKLAEEDDG
jgi:hypothetical protein